MTGEVSPQADAAGSAPGAGRWVGRLGALVLGLVLLVAAAAKALDPLAFAQQIHAQGLDVVLSAPTLAVLAIALEVALGLLLVLGVRRLWVLAPAALLVAFFVFLTGRDAWRAAHGTLPADAACGCFGNLVERTPMQALWQDVLLLVPALAAAFVARDRGGRFPAARTALAAAGTVGAAAFAVAAPALPLDDYATRLRPGASAVALCAGSGDERVCLDSIVPELASGRHLVVLADLGDQTFGRAVNRLNEFASSPGEPSLWVVAAASPEEKNAFFWRYGPTFEIRDAPAALLRPLYRRLPRGFLVQDGRVVRTWSGLPPLEHEFTGQFAARSDAGG
jgi:uncharacterized membrane protein YphA (DoxX/SURF4 family)